jgi:hypothetical protein
LWCEHLGQFVAFQRNVDFGGGVEGIRREHRAQKVFLKQNSVLTISCTTASLHNYESLNVFNRNGREILRNKRFNLFTKPTSHHTYLRHTSNLQTAVTSYNKPNAYKPQFQATAARVPQARLVSKNEAKAQHA